MDTFEKLSVLEKGLVQSLSKSAEAGVVTPLAASVAAPVMVPTEASAVQPEPIAIIGMAGNFPACMTLQEFWAALDLDTSLIQQTPDSRAGMSAPGTPPGKHWGGFIPDIAGFDADFFDISALDANVMDPRQRLLLMSVYHCLEDACCTPGSLAAATPASTLRPKKISMPRPCCNWVSIRVMESASPRACWPIGFPIIST